MASVSIGFMILRFFFGHFGISCIESLILAAIGVGCCSLIWDMLVRSSSDLGTLGVVFGGSSAERCEKVAFSGVESFKKGLIAEIGRFLTGGV